MEEKYKAEIEWAGKHRKEIRKFIEKLKALKPSDLDSVCQDLDEKAFQQIDCMKCGNCCKTTGPLLRDKDIDHLAAEKGIKPGKFTETFLRIDEDGDYVFKALPCPFLGAENVCSVYSSRPNACRDFPHTGQRKMINKIHLMVPNSNICPAVSVVIKGLMERYKG